MERFFREAVERGLGTVDSVGCLPLKTAQDSWILQKILDRLVVEILFTSLYCIVELKTKFTELKKANSQKQTYQKGELRSKLALLAAS